MIWNPIACSESGSSDIKAMGGEISRYLSWSHDLPKLIRKNSAGEKLPIRKQKSGDQKHLPLSQGMSS